MNPGDSLDANGLNKAAPNKTAEAPRKPKALTGVLASGSGFLTALNFDELLCCVPKGTGAKACVEANVIRRMELLNLILQIFGTTLSS
mmetsp:Transcript_21194/g.32146  ORF Transcript_21194/g.32146 Transcript_21194/m.32146 type:complete len:88 (+) Transcript_21194:1067-1330(+)